MSITGNEHRDRAITSAIEMCKERGLEPTRDNVATYCEHLPNFGELGEDELTQFTLAEQSAPVPDDVQNAHQVSAASADTEPRLTRDECLEQITALEGALALARTDRIARDRELVQARGQMAEAVMLWQTGGRKLTPLQNAHEYIRSELEKRRRIAKGELIPTVTPLRQRSYIDRAAAGGIGGDANDFARKRITQGRFGRFGFSRAEATRIEAHRKAQAAAQARQAAFREQEKARIAKQQAARQQPSK
jgi:hypothetical protein